MTRSYPAALLLLSVVLVGADEDWSTVNFPAGLQPILPCPDDADFCENVDDYPFAQDSGVGSRLFKGEDDLPKFSVRIGSDLVQESPACDSRKSIVYPRKAQNTAGDYLFIKNTASYKQAVDVEQCLGEGKVCRTDDDAPQSGRTVCRQKYTVYKMLAMDNTGKETLDTFSLPSACLCYYQDKPFGLRSSFEDVPVLSVCKPEDGPKVERTVATCSSPVGQLQQRGGPVVFARRKKRHHRIWHQHNRDLPRGGALSVVEPASGCDTTSTYCEASPCYPTKQALLEKLKQEPSSQLLDQLFKGPCADQLDGIATRRFNINEQPLCEGVKRVIFPKQALNLRNEWKYVVNVGNYTQAVEVEECNPSRKTSSSSVQTADGVSQSYGSCLYAGSSGNNPSTTVCRQLYSQHQLLSLSGDGQLVVDTFRLPVACDCYIREDFELVEFKSGFSDGG